MVISVTGCAYFNTFYNAKKLFNEAQSISLDDKGRPKATAIQKYNKSIKKCGIILTDYQKSKWADDALFLLGQSLFYKGNNYIQAIEQFEDLILLYPNSELVPDARLYIARSKFRSHKKKEAYQLLQDFINDPTLKENHPKALMNLANYHLEKNELVEAHNTLNKLISDYPKSDEYEEAFFLQGKTLFIDKKYSQSNEVFRALIKSKISKKIKLDSRYFLILNNLELNQYEEAYDLVKKLLKDEYRTERIADLEIVQARSLVGIGELENAVTIFQNVISNNKRTRIAADASFYLAETYFKVTGDYESAIESYNNVKSSFSNSEFVELSLSRSAVASKIIQFNNPETDIPINTLIEQQFKLAEFYNEVLNRPDSALAIYDRIISNETKLPILIDSLETLKIMRDQQKKNLTTSDIDEIILSDTLTSDTLMLDPFPVDSLDMIKKNELALRELANLDSIMIDTVNVNLNSYLEKNKEDFEIYNAEYIPFARFIKIWLLYNTYEDTLEAVNTYNKLEAISPENEYTIAAEKLLNNEEFEIENPVRKEHDIQYQAAIDILDKDPENSLVRLSEIAENPEHSHYIKANYTLGYYLYFIQSDTVSSKTFFDFILNSDAEEYKTSIRKFYDQNGFKNYERLDKISLLEAEETKPVEEEIIPDSTDTEKSIEEENLLPAQEVSERKHSQSEKEITVLSETIIEIPARFQEIPDVIEAEIFFRPDGRPGQIILEETIRPGSPLQVLISNIIKTWKYNVPSEEAITDKPLKVNVELIKSNKE